MRLRIRLILACVLCTGWPRAAAFAEFYQAPFGRDGTWTVYELVDIPMSWREANDRAAQQRWGGVTGYLVDVNSLQENALLEYLAAVHELDFLWLGLTDREGAAPVNWSQGLPAPQESSSLANPQLQGWAWTSGADFSYQNWDPQEPLNYDGREDAARLRSDGRWDDIGSGFDLDRPQPPQWQPGTSLPEMSSWRHAFVVEYPTESNTPVPEVPAIVVPSRFPTRLPGLDGKSGALGVTDYRLDEPRELRLLTVSNMLSQVADGTLTLDSSAAQIAWSDVTDPESRHQGGPILATEPLRYPSDRAGVDDDHFISVAKGTIRVPQSGSYTIQVRSASGFALQIGDQEFQTVYGAGQIDPDDRRTLYFPAETGDTDTRGVIQLSEGDHELRFINWNTRGLSFWEITSAQGEFATEANAQWLAVGDPSIRLESHLEPAVRLVGTATVATVSESQGGLTRDIELAREIVEIGQLEGRALRRDDVATVVLRDHDGICCNRPGRNLDTDQVYLWPLNDETLGGTPAGEDNFSSAIYGQIAVDDGDDVAGESLAVTFGVFSSDGAQLRIMGGSFQEASETGDLSYEVDGDVTLTFNDVTSNTDIYGLIELTEGVTYGLEAIHFEERGDAGFEIWTALGRHLDGFDEREFLPLSSVLGTRLAPANRGLELVAAGQRLQGDYNDNGSLDADDLDRLTAAMSTPDIQFDLDHNGQVDPTDRGFWIRVVKQSWLGDADLDGQFDSADLVAVMQRGKYERDEFATWSEGDWSGDGRFGSSDIVAAFQDGGYGHGPRAAHPAVPEPCARFLLLTGLGLTTGLRPKASSRRRRQPLASGRSHAPPGESP